MLAFACRGLGGVVPEFDDMEVWRPGMPSFLLVYHTPCEGPCAALMDLWEAAAKKFPGLMRVLPRGRCPGAASTPGSTPRLSAVCELAFPEGSSPAEPDVVVWTGEKYERYAGRRSTEALMQAILEAGQRVASPAAAAAEVAFDSTVSDLGASGADARDWKATLLRSLSLFGRLGPRMGPDTEKPIVEEIMRGLEACFEAVASRSDPKRAELLVGLARAGYHELALRFEARLDERFGSAPPRAAAAAALEGARDAYVTLVTEADPLYGVGAEVLGLSIQAAEAERMAGLGGRGETRALVALVSNEPEMDGAARRLTAVGYDEVLRVETLSCAPLRGPAEGPEYFETACTKLHVFNLTRFRTVLYLDADAVVTHEAATSLFDRQLTSERPLAAAPDPPASSLFNTGVLLLKPSAELFAALLDGLDGGDSYDGADQGYLNGVFSEWYAWSATHRLSPRFNLQQVVSAAHEPTFRHYERQGVAVFQFVGRGKPWLPAHARAWPTDGTPTEPYYRMWRSLADESWAITTGQRELSADAWAGAWKQLHRDIHARAPRASRPSARG